MFQYSFFLSLYLSIIFASLLLSSHLSYLCSTHSSLLIFPFVPLIHLSSSLFHFPYSRFLSFLSVLLTNALSLFLFLSSSVVPFYPNSLSFLILSHRPPSTPPRQLTPALSYPQGAPNRPTDRPTLTPSFHASLISFTPSSKAHRDLKYLSSLISR